jgi:hypothetical protein
MKLLFVVRIISTLNFAVAAFVLFFGVETVRTDRSFTEWPAILLLLSLAAVLIVSGAGLWRVRKWGWWIVASAHSWGVAAAVMSLQARISAMVNLRAQGYNEIEIPLSTAIIRLLIHLSIVVYLAWPAVRNRYKASAYWVPWVLAGQALVICAVRIYTRTMTSW